MGDFIVRGVPRRLARDAWWMAAESGRAGGGLSNPPPVPGTWGPMAARSLALIPVLVALADLMLWGVTARLGWAVLALTLGLALHALVGVRGPRSHLRAWGTLVLAVLPVIEEVQALSLLFLFAGLTVFAAILIRGDDGALTPGVLRVALRLWPAGTLRMAKDMTLAPGLIRSVSGDKILPLQIARDWALPLGLGFVFLILLTIANPLIEGALRWVEAWEPEAFINPARWAFWGLAGLMLWPILRLPALTARLLANSPETAAPAPLFPQVLNARTVTRSLMMLNLLFAVQSLTDAAYLWGGVQLPVGLTYAQYAHRGAYPLIVAALLAGGFAVIAQPFLPGRPMLRRLLLIWVAQTVLLVLSSLLRLDLYVEAYGLTRLRFLAGVWMGLVAVGLALMIWQIVARRSLSWFLGWVGGIGAGTLYILAFVNVAGLVADFDLSRSKWIMDAEYLCSLGPGAAPAIAAFEAKAPGPFCVYTPAPAVTPPSDLREWGYRNWRLRRNLAALAAAQTKGQTE